MFSRRYPMVSGREYDDDVLPTTIMTSSGYNNNLIYKNENEVLKET